MWKQILYCQLPAHRILNFISKLIDKIAAKLLSSALLNKLVLGQHGILKRHYTLTNLFIYCDFITTLTKTHRQIDSLYSDFSKALELVDHQILAQNFWDMGIRGSLLNRLQSYLVGRRYAVLIRNGCLEFFTAPSEVPQGSSLGSILLATFLNDLIRVIRSSKALLYADVKVFRAVNSPLDCSGLQRKLDAFIKWSILNGLPLNTEKCEIISFSRSPNKTVFNSTINGKPLSRLS